MSNNGQPSIYLVGAGIASLAAAAYFIRDSIIHPSGVRTIELG